jgi:hypothetical protein
MPKVIPLLKQLIDILGKNIAKSQKKAIEIFIGSLDFDKTFDPKDLDADLAKKIKK